MMKKTKQQLLQSESGTTMVEILVAFVILILIMGIFSQSMNLAGKMIGRSNDTLTNYRELARGYYLEDSGIVETEESGNKSMTLTRTSGDTEEFTIQVKIKTYTKTEGNGKLVEVVCETTAAAEE